MTRLDQGVCRPQEHGQTNPAETEPQRPDLLQPDLYRARNLIERFFNKISNVGCRDPIRQTRGNDLAFGKTRINPDLLRANESTPS